MWQRKSRNKVTTLPPRTLQNVSEIEFHLQVSTAKVSHFITDFSTVKIQGYCKNIGKAVSMFPEEQENFLHLSTFDDTILQNILLKLTFFWKTTFYKLHNCRLHLLEHHDCCDYWWCLQTPVWICHSLEITNFKFLFFILNFPGLRLLLNQILAFPIPFCNFAFCQFFHFLISEFRNFESLHLVDVHLVVFFSSSEQGSSCDSSSSLTSYDSSSSSEVTLNLRDDSEVGKSLTCGFETRWKSCAKKQSKMNTKRGNINLQIPGAELLVKDGESLPSAKRAKSTKVLLSEFI